MTIREIIKRDIGIKIEGVVKVFDRAALASEFREYVVTDKIEDELKKIFDTFTQVSDTCAVGPPPRRHGNVGIGILWVRNISLRQGSWIPPTER